MKKEQFEKYIEEVTRERVLLEDYISANPGLPNYIYFAIKQRCNELDKVIMMYFAKNVTDS